MTETDSEEKSDSEAEQTESTEDDKETGVTDTSVEPAEETPEVTSEEDSEEAPEGNAAESGELNAVASTASVISKKVVEKDGTEEKDAAGTADIVYLYGCVDSENKLAEGRDLKFKVEPAAGRKIVANGVTITLIDNADSTKTKAGSVAVSDGIYTATKAQFAEGTGENAKTYSAEIKVETAAITGYKVKFAGAKDCVPVSYKIYPVVAKSDEDNTEVLDAEIADAVATDVKYGESKKFALELTADDEVVKNKLTGITLNGTTITPSEATEELAEKSNDDNKHNVYTFTVDPSKAGDLGDTNEDNKEAKVEVMVVAKKTLTITAGADDTAVAEIKAPTAADESYIPYVEAKNGFDVELLEGDADLETKSLAFKADFKTGKDATHKITGVTVTAEDGKKNAVATLTAEPITGKANEYTVALSPLKDFAVDTTLTITVNTDLDTDKAEKVRTVNFTGAGDSLKHVTINVTEGSEAAKDLKDDETSLTTAEDTVKIKVTPDTGYELTKGTKVEGGTDNSEKQIVSVVENRMYKASETATDYTETKALAAVEKVAYDSDSSGYTEITLPSLAAGSDKNYIEDAADADPALGYIVTSIDVTINTVVSENDKAKGVTFENNLKGATYKIDTAAVFKDNETDDEDAYWIPKTVQTLDFTVTSAVEPKVEVLTVKSKLEVLKVAETTENTYKYSIPVAAIADSDATITIIAKEAATEKEVAVKAALDANDVSITDEEGVDVSLGAKGEDGLYTLAEEVTVGDEIEYTFAAKQGAEITKISWTMDGESQPDLTARRGVYVLKTTVTGEIVVTVESKSDIRVILGGKGVELKGDTYTVDYDKAKDITVNLQKAETEQDLDFYNIVVKEGGKTAATVAEMVDTKSAKIAKVEESEYGSVLTIEVYVKGTADPYTAKLQTTKPSETVTVTYLDSKGKAVDVTKTAPSMKVDSEMTFTVKAADGSNLNDLAVEILAEEGAAAATDADAKKLINVGSIDPENGTLVITANPAAEAQGKVKVSITNKNKTDEETKKALVVASFALDLTAPLVKTAEIKELTATAGSSSNSEVRLNLGLTYADKKKVPVGPKVGALYYKVATTKVEATQEGITGEDARVDYIPVDLSVPAYTDLISLVKSYKENKVVDIDEELTTTATVTLVQSLVESPAKDEDYVAASGEPKSVTLNTKRAVYETTLKLTTLNKATVFTGQTIKVAAPKFTADTSYDELTVQFVNTKTGELYGWASDDGRATNGKAAYNSAFYAWVDRKDNSVYVNVSSSVRVDSSSYKNLLKTLGVKVTAAGPDDSYRASAIQKLKVQQGINTIGVNESKATLPTTIYKSGKKVTVKITPLFNGGTKPAKSTVKWTLSALDGSNGYMESVLNKVITVKNGTVSIDTKKYQIQNDDDDNKFKVTITANDFARGDGDQAAPTKTVTFEITDEKTAVGNIVLVKSDGYYSTPLDMAALGAEDFTNTTVYVAALKSDAKPDNAGRYATDDFQPVTFKSNAKAVLDVASQGTPAGKKTAVNFKKPGKVTITATSVDGSKSTNKVTFTVNPYKQLALMIKDAEKTCHYGDVVYSGGSNEKFELYVGYVNADGKFVNINNYKNLKLSVGSGKFLAYAGWKKNYSNYMGDAVVVNSTKNGIAKITLTDTANKNKKTNSVSYTITNTSWTKAKAPKIKLVGKVQEYQPITWQTDKSYAGSYVNLSADKTVAYNKNGAYDMMHYWDDDANSGEGGYVPYTGHSTILKIDENGQFTFEEPQRSFSCSSYKLVATIGDMVNGEFVASAKDVKLSFNIPLAKYNKGFGMTTSYTLDKTSAASTKLILKGQSTYVVGDTQSIIQKSSVQLDTKVHANNFAKYFTVGAVYDADDNYLYSTIGLRPELTEDDVKYITGDSAEAKADCQGYITLSGNAGKSYANYVPTRKDFLVKISFKDAKYSLTGATIFANEANKKVTAENLTLMSGKNTLDAAYATVADAAGFAEKATVANGKINIEGAAEAGTYKVALKVLPVTSGYIYYDAKTEKYVPVSAAKDATALKDLEEVCNKYGVNATATIVVKDLTTTKIASVKNTKYTLTANGYEIGSAGKMGNYVVYAPYTIAIDGTDIAANNADATKAGVAVNMVKNDVDQNKVTDKINLVKAETATTRVNGKDVPAIKLSVSKEALLLLSAEGYEKPVTTYGKNKKLTVPVTVKYTNGVTTEDTITFTLTMPTKAPTDLAGVKALVNESAVKDVLTKKLLTASAILGQLKTDVTNKATSVIPKDTDVIVAASSMTAVPTEDEKDEDMLEGIPAYDDIMERGQAKITLTLKDNAKTTSNEDTVEFKYNIDLKGSVVNEDTEIAEPDVTAIVTAIETSTDALSEKVKNSTLKTDLLNMIKELDEVAPLIAKKKNISLKVSSFDSSKKATVNSNGTIKATILVRNLASGYSETAVLTLTIKKMDSISKAETEVKALFNTETLMNAIVEKCSAQKDVIEAYAKAAAEAKFNNEDIKVTVTADVTPVKPAVTEGENKADAEDGKVVLTITLKYEGGKEVEITSAVGTIDATKTYMILNAAKAEVEKVLTADALKAVMDDEKNPVENNETAIQTAVETEINKVVGDSGTISGYSWKWAQITKKDGTKEEDFTYTPATQGNPGKLTFNLELTSVGMEEVELTGATVTISQTALEVKAANDDYQTAEELEAAIKKLATDSAATPIKVDSKLTDANAAKSALDNEIKKVNTAKPAITVTVTNAEAKEGVPATAYVAETGAYTNVEIKVGTEGKPFTADFTFVVPEEDS